MNLCSYIKECAFLFKAPPFSLVAGGVAVNIESPYLVSLSNFCRVHHDACRTEPALQCMSLLSEDSSPYDGLLSDARLFRNAIGMRIYRDHAEQTVATCIDHIRKRGRTTATRP